ARRKRRSMHDEVETAEGLVAAPGDIGNLLVAGDIQRQDQRIGQLLGQFAYVFAKTIALVGHREPCALGSHGLGDGPRDGALVGDTNDQSGSAGELAHVCCVSESSAWGLLAAAAVTSRSWTAIAVRPWTRPLASTPWAPAALSVAMSLRARRHPVPVGARSGRAG